QGECRVVRVKPHSSVGIVHRHVLARLKMNRRIPGFAGGCIGNKSGWIGWITWCPYQAVDTVSHFGAGSLIEFKVDEPGWWHRLEIQLSRGEPSSGHIQTVNRTNILQ